MIRSDAVIQTKVNIQQENASNMFHLAHYSSDIKTIAALEFSDKKDKGIHCFVLLTYRLKCCYAQDTLIRLLLDNA